MKKNATWYLPYTINFLEACTSAMFVHFEPESSGSSKSVHTAHTCLFRKKYVIVLYPARCFHPLNFIPAFSFSDFSTPQFHPCIFIPRIFHPCIIQFDKGLPNVVNDFFSHPNIFGVFVYFLASLMHLPTYKTQGSILYYPHLDIGTFKVYKYLLTIFV